MQRLESTVPDHGEPDRPCGDRSVKRELTIQLNSLTHFRATVQTAAGLCRPISMIPREVVPESSGMATGHKSIPRGTGDGCFYTVLTLLCFPMLPMLGFPWPRDPAGNGKKQTWLEPGRK